MCFSITCVGVGGGHNLVERVRGLVGAHDVSVACVFANDPEWLAQLWSVYSASFLPVCAYDGGCTA